MKYSVLAEATPQNNWILYVMMGLIVVFLVLTMVISSRRNKKHAQEEQARIDAVKPGNKVTTIGGVSGIVVEVNAEENTFVLETGSEQSGKTYIKFIRQAIYESDAVVETAAPEAKSEEVEEQPAPAEEAPVAEEKTEAPAEDAPAEEKTEE